MRCCHPTKSALVKHLTRAILIRATLVALLLSAVAWFWYYLSRFSYLPGTDAYYYALQAQSMLETGHLKVPGNGVLYYAIAFTAWCGGIAIETAVRIVLTVVFAFMIAALWFHAMRMRREVQLLGIVLMAIAAPVIAFHAIEFPRLTLGLAVVPILLRLAAEDGAIGKPRLWLVLAGSSLLHPLVAVLNGLFVGGLLLTAWWSRQQRSGVGLKLRQSLRVIVAVAVFAIFILSAWPGLGLRLMSISLGAPGLLALVTSPGLPVDVKTTVLFFWMLLASLSIYHAIRSRGRYRYLPLAVLGLAWLPNADNGLIGLGGRLALAFVLIAVPVVLMILNEWDWQWVVLSRRRAHLLRVGVAVVVLLMLLAFPLRIRDYHKLLATGDYGQYAKVVAFMRQREIPLLIAHRGLDFYYTYRLRRDAFHFDPEPNWNMTRIWRVALRVTPEELAFYAPAACQWGNTAMQIHGTPLLFVREDCWEQFRAHLSFHDNPDLYQEAWQDAENPSQPRPAFLRKKYHKAENQWQP